RRRPRRRDDPARRPRPPGRRNRPTTSQALPEHANPSSHSQHAEVKRAHSHTLHAHGPPAHIVTDIDTSPEVRLRVPRTTREREIVSVEYSITCRRACDHHDCRPAKINNTKPPRTARSRA